MNYILFFPDELRAETLSCYGHQTIKTPNYEKLAEEGVLFEQCHVQNPVCSPSRCSLVTGQYVHVNGHRTLWNLLKPHEKNMMQYFKNAGYEVRVYGKNDVMTKQTADHSCDVFEDKHGVKAAASNAKPVTPYGEPGYYDFLYTSMDGDYKEHMDYQNLKAGMEFMKNRKPTDKPFVLFLPLTMPHCPYSAHEPYHSMYQVNDVMPLRERGTNKPQFHEYIRQYRDLSQSDLRKQQAVYMGMVSFNDQLLGELMDCMKETGLDENTMLIASADHGDYAGDYGLVEKWPSGCEDVLTRVPLLIKAPYSKQGHRVKEQVELFDIMATMLEDAKIPCEHTHFAKSLVPQLHGEPGDPDRAVFCEGGYNLNEPHCNEGIDKPTTAFMTNKKTIYYPKGLHQKEHPKSVGRATMIRTLSHKLVLRTYGDHELYDLRKDPKELYNVYGEEAYVQVQLQLKERMLDWFTRTSDVVPVEEDPRGFR